MEKNNKYIKSKLEIPVIYGDNKEIEEKVNKQIKGDIMDYYNNSLKEAESFQEDFETDNTNFSADVSYYVKKNTDKVISLVLYFYKYSGGAHGYYEYVPYNINMRNGEVINLKDLFKNDADYKNILNGEIKNQVDKLEKEQSAEGIYDFKSINDNQKFYIQNDNIVIYFDLYEIAPYAAGVPEFTINIKKIKNNIKDNYIILFK
ncbi:MAG: DUF3298 and DUF4163 domain-containing protein [Terrisporobacter sp.]|uniref:DUF3298 and DUF4163 domain-containing protein n=1 Tax=Terrisporobacter sp. TaxID=1965305 RepID=UPI002FCB9190